jgi:hypothetical protein
MIPGKRIIACQQNFPSVDTKINWKNTQKYARKNLIFKSW